MLKFRFYSSLLLLIAVFTGITSCSEDEEEQKNKTAEPGKMIATADGKAWTAETPVVLIYNGQITVTGVASDGSQIVISVKATQAGTFAISGKSTATLPNNVVSFSPPNASTNNPVYASTNITVATAGEVVITEIDQTNKTISGTFTSQVARLLPTASTIEIKGGSFTKVAYTDKPSNVPGNTFSAKVNGSDFTLLQVGATSSFGKIVINASGSGSKTISVTVPLTTATGTFNFDAMGGSYVGVYMVGSTAYDSNSGSVQISKHDKTAKRIEGTFSFNAELFPTGGSAQSITSGSFAVSY